MTSAMYQPETTRSFYNNWGANEWNRLESSFENRINYQIHRTILGELVKPGDRVLEAGAGPGRFTLELTKAGAEVTVCDLSDVQLAFNKEKVTEAGLAGNVTGWHQADIVDLSRFPSAGFDTVVCVGSVLSCVLDRIPEAFDELIRLVRPGGTVIVSVTSRYGYLRAGLNAILPMVAAGGQLGAIDQAVATGDIAGVQADFELLTTHFFTWDELRTHLTSRGCEIVTASASNFLSADTPLLDESLLADPEVMAAFTRWELQACRAPGNIDGGTHIIAAARKAE
ncbi:SAM-dependent methyltransferase [Actinokineospora spheciospongiae]|uniref:SAM-dependent methyltransferase n=1 Tax=Actinokineospora spheciospongiae TaxID=909613 RepID=W7J3X9_9PSEU|nr:class I SAM-dependent methyltransferase [Actinokineospora spheciospongiae]EWC63686.1 SAM-dependent methyltransferase [Actinokineospora spheciospongiae]PWW66616.1 methyltransferase family protein [Actinokineospora spheciospongiae]